MIFETIADDFVSICRRHPEILVFLSLGIGYFVGKIKVVGFSLGATASVLLTALVLGQMDVTITPLIKAIAFAFFIFTIGYKVGPQFFGALKKEGIQYLILAIFFAVIGLVTAVLLGKFLSFDQGTAAGLLAGALTQSSVIGTAEGAIHNLSISASQQTTLVSNIAIAYAITYIFGVAGLILFYKIVPKILKLNLKEAARTLESKLSGTKAPEDPDIFAWNTRPNIRIYRVTNKSLIGKKVGDLKKLFTKKLTLEQIRRKKQLIDPTPSTIIDAGDIVAVIGDRQSIIGIEKKIGPEIDDSTLSNLPTEMLRICITKSQVAGKRLGTILRKFGQNCFIGKVTRQGIDLPLRENTIVAKGDVLYAVGLKKDIENFASKVGYAEHRTNATDMVMVGLGCFLGTLLGIASVKLGGIPLTLGIGGGVLVAGLLAGWLRSIRPTFGRIPSGAQWILTNVGLNLFIACVGLTAGPRAVHALQEKGIALFLAGVALTLTPHIISLIFGRLVLKMDYVLLLGALTGAGTATPSLNVLKNEADSSLPALGYTVPYALGNFILTIWGTLIVSLM